MRKMKKLILFTVFLMVIPGGSMLYAASGKSEVAVYLNNVLQKQSGILSEGDAYLSAQQLSENLDAFVSLDDSGKEIRFYKPNVNTVLIDAQGGIFGKVKSDNRNTFSVLVQVDNLKTVISDLKVTITDSEDKTETIDTESIKENKENFWFKSDEFSYTFNKKGSYAVRVYLKDMSSNKWFRVSEIQIITI